jgi:hypothetical protein
LPPSVICGRVGSMAANSSAALLHLRVGVLVEAEHIGVDERDLVLHRPYEDGWMVALALHPGPSCLRQLSNRARLRLRNLLAASHVTCSVQAIVGAFAIEDAGAADRDAVGVVEVQRLIQPPCRRISVSPQSRCMFWPCLRQVSTAASFALP